MIISPFPNVLCLLLAAALLCQGIVSPACSAQSEGAPFAKATLQQPDQPWLVAQLGHSESITSVAVSPDNRYVLTGSSDNTARLWERETGIEVRVFVGEAAVFSPDGRFVLTGSDDRTPSMDWTARLWDRDAGREV